MRDAVRILPRFRPRLAAARNRVKAPYFGAVCCTEGHHFAADSQLSTGFADENHVLPYQRHGGRIFAGARVHNCPVPEKRAGCRVECEQMTVGSAADDAAVRDCGSLVVLLAHVCTRMVLIAPTLLATRRINGERTKN